MERALADCRAAHADPTTRTAPWARYFNRNGALAEAAGVYALLGNLDAARAAIVRALHGHSDQPTAARALALADVALAAARIGDTDTAVSAATLAAPLADKLEVAMAQRKLSSLIPLLGR